MSRTPRNSIWLVAMLVAACSKQAPPAPPPAPVSVATVSEREVQEWDEFTGRIEATDSVEIRPRVPGYIEKIAYTEGKDVKKGDVLFVIDQRPYQAEVRRAEAEPRQGAHGRGAVEERRRTREEPCSTRARSRRRSTTRASRRCRAASPPWLPHRPRSTSRS
jgi:multidrug efflux system membrane fusion protein